MIRFKTFFKDLIDPKIIVGILIILIICVLATMFFGSKVESFKQKYRSKFFTYLIAILLIFALITFIGSSEIFNSHLFSIYIFYQAIFFIMGIIHCYIYRSYFEKFDKESPWIEVLFNFLIILYSSISIVIVYTIIKGNLFAYNMALSALAFMVPTVIYLTFEAAIAIPPKIYETWVFPEEHAYPDPPDSEYRDMYLVTFILHREPNSKVRMNFSAKAPMRMDFGRLFYHFVNDYNLRNPDSKIILTDKNGGQQHWVFFLKSKNFGFAQTIKPKYPLHVNHIGENSIIICERTPPSITSKEELEEMRKNADSEEENTPQEETEKNKNF